MGSLVSVFSSFLFLFFSFLSFPFSKLYAQAGAWIHDTEIKNHMLHSLYQPQIEYTTSDPKISLSLFSTLTHSLGGRRVLRSYLEHGRPEFKCCLCYIEAERPGATYPLWSWRSLPYKMGLIVIATSQVVVRMHSAMGAHGACFEMHIIKAVRPRPWSPPAWVQSPGRTPQRSYLTSLSLSFLIRKSKIITGPSALRCWKNWIS